MLRRLFPSPVTIVSYSPEPQPICAAEQVHKLREEVCPEDMGRVAEPVAKLLISPLH